MPNVYKTPGVYVEEIAKFPPSVAQVETAIPAFIGYTASAQEVAENDLRNQAVRISSMRQYEALFGGPPAQNFSVAVAVVEGTTEMLPSVATLPSPSPFKMFHSVQAYFANGGGPCYIISMGSYEDSISASRLNASTNGGLTIAGRVDEITLYLFPDAAALTPSDYYNNVYSAALNECARLQDRFTILDVKMNATSAPTPANPHNPVTVIRDSGTSLGNNLKYGAAYYPWIQSVFSYSYGVDYGQVNITFTDAEGGDMDGNTWEDLSGSNHISLTNRFEAELQKVIGKLRVELPPSPFVAGAYATVDRTRGVWKAPANVSLSAAIKPMVKITDQDQMDYNVHSSGRSVNAIRSFTGRGTLIWGVRTLDGNSNEWKYASVRRFFNMVEESVKNASAQFVFEPNDANTWVRIRAMIENYLTLQWRAGALAGASPEDAFYVRVGLGQTMTADDILNGSMIVEMGLAVVRPAEFIVLRFSHKMQES